MLDDIGDMNDYLRAYGRTLADNIKERAEPLFNPGEPWDDRLYGLLKKPYQAQGDAIMGLSTLLDDYSSAMVVGEMGGGKTLMGLAVPYIHDSPDKPARTLVMCPGHLVKKWQREALETIPDADASIIRKLEDVLYVDREAEPERPEYTIVSKDRAKLGYAWRPAALEKRDGYHCPTCYGLVLDKDGIPVEYDYLTRNKRWCPACEGALWQADNTRIRRYPIAEYIKKYLPGYFDFLIADEVHELKGGNTAQGNAFGALASACGKTIALTGTLRGGYADDVFYVLYRLSPEAMKNDELDYGQVTRWMSRYGVPERTTKYYPQDNVFSKGKKGGTRGKRKPGVSPAVFSKHLLNKTVFLDLEDVASDLPPLSEEVDGIEMDEDLAEAYQELEDELSAAVRSALSQGDKSLLGTYVNTLLSYPDRPFDNEPLIHPHTEEIIAVPIELPKDKVYNKERKLVEVVKNSLADGRRVFTYCQYTGKKDVTTRLQERAMQLMGSKLEASLAIEGKFSEEGLLAMTQGEDMTTALAKTLVDGLEGEGVEEVWSKLNQTNAAYRGKEAFGDGLLFYVDPRVVDKRKKRRGRRTPRGTGQLSLLDGL